MNPEASPVAELPRILALATRLEGKGQYNVAKLLRAVADALARRAAYRLGFDRDLEGILRDLESVTAALPGREVDPAIVTALERGRRALHEGRTPFADELADPYVCRRCGEMALEQPTAVCPACGAWGSTFQRFWPVYWFSEFEPFEALTRLGETPTVVARLLEGLPEPALTARPDDGGWSMHQVVTHLRDAQGVLATRVRLFLEHERPTLSSQAVYEWATREGEPATTAEIFEQYRGSRADTVETLEELPLRDWWRTGLHEEFGTVTLRQQVSYFAAHELTHLRHLNALRKAALAR